MVIDSSALLAILLSEPEAATFAQAIADDPSRLVSTVSFLETSIVVTSRKGDTGTRELDHLLQTIGAAVVGFDPTQAVLARAAYERFGKGRHPAKLNLGDCCSYALARSSGQPLLCKGDDFVQTDVTLAI